LQPSASSARKRRRPGGLSFDLATISGCGITSYHSRKEFNYIIEAIAPGSIATEVSAIVPLSSVEKQLDK
jgi:hypothetical protein